MDGLLSDVRHANRVLLNAPGFTLAAVLTLAFGIGANVAMFSIVYGVLLRPLPYRDADRLVIPRAELTYSGTNRPVPLFVQGGEIAAWRGPFDAMSPPAFYTTSDNVALTGENGTDVLASAVVSDTFFSTLAGPFAAGRPLDSSDDNEPAAVISARLAQRLFGGPQRAIGEPLALSRGVVTVIGVADRAFQFPSGDVDLWLPAGFSRAANPRCCSYQLIARLDSHGAVDRAVAAVEPFFKGSTAGQKSGSDAIRTSVVRLSDDMVSTARPALLVLFAAVLMVLVVVCGNLINLLLARNASREREFAVRRALGASTGQLTRQLLVESAMLATAGAAGGVLLARASLVAVSRFAAAAVPRLDAIEIDRPALLFAAGLAALATILTGLMPAVRAAHAAVSSRAAAGTATPWRTRRLQQSMCVVQVALAVMLVVGASLMGRSLVRLLDVDLGVTTERVLTASLTLSFGARPPDAETLARIERLVGGVRALPGVQAAGVGTSLPPSVSRMVVTLRRSGDSVDYRAAAVPATPGYFDALRMRLISGRFFTDADDDRRPPVVIVSEDTARRFFGTADPIGQTMEMPVLRDGKQSSARMTVVGVTANVRYAGLAAPPDDIVYRPFAQQPWVAPYLVVRTSGDPADFAQTVRRAIAAVDKGAVVSEVTTLNRLVLDATAQPQFRTVLLASLAVLALVIATVGLYGVVAYTVSRRTKEIGIRLALGATSRTVLRIVLVDGLLIAVAGIAAGTAGAFLLARALAGLLYGIAPGDPLSYALAAVGLIALTLLASYVPARRAAGIDPVAALRTE